MTDVYFLFYDNEIFGVYQGFDDLLLGYQKIEDYFDYFNPDLTHHIKFSYDDAFYIKERLLNMF